MGLHDVHTIVSFFHSSGKTSGIAISCCLGTEQVGVFSRIDLLCCAEIFQNGFVDSIPVALFGIHHLFDYHQDYRAQHGQDGIC